MTSDYQELPENLPIPQDDGLCDHLVGMRLPETSLISTAGDLIDTSTLKGRVVIYCYPMTGKPGVPLPEGWDSIPGARGCTPQSCSFRDHHQELKALNSRVFGLSTQSTEYQKEAVDRLHLPFDILSDIDLSFSKALRLPMFEIDGQEFLQRVTLITKDSMIEAVHYPVFPSDSDASWVINYLSSHQ